MSFSLKIEPEWNVIKRIKEMILKDEAVAAYGKDFQEQALLAAIELVENGLKYSDGPQAFPVDFRFEMSKEQCLIEVRNRTSSELHRQALRETLDKMRSGDPFEMNVERLEQVKHRPDGFSRMGLIRIIYEAEFELSADIQGDQIVMRAVRKLEPQGTVGKE